jgi:predicted metal-binding protein
LVWAPKYRKWVKRENIRDKAGEIFGEIAENYGFEIQEMRVAPDHVHILMSFAPRCAGYGQYLTCPPYVMSVDTFSRIRSEYNWCLLVQVEAKDIDLKDKGKGKISQAILKENNKLHHPFKLKLLEVVEAVASAAFKKGMRFATGLVGGSCVFCERCVDNKSSDACRHPFRARSPMEAAGIDVVKTAQKAGLPIHLSSSKNVVWTGLVLLE